MDVKTPETGSQAASPEGVATDLEAFREQQRTQIAHTLVAIVAAEGLSAANVTSLTRAVHLSRKTFYKYFPTIDAALVHTQRLALAEMASIAAPVVGNGRQQLIGGLQHLRQFTMERPIQMQFLSFFDFAVRQYGLSPSEQSSYDAAVRLLVREPLKAFTTGQADGSIRPDLDAADTVLTCTNAVFGLAQRLVGIAGFEDAELRGRLLQIEIARWDEFIRPSHA